MRSWIFRLLAVMALLAAVEAGVRPSSAEAETCTILYCCPNGQICAIRCGNMLIDFMCL